MGMTQEEIKVDEAMWRERASKDSGVSVDLINSLFMNIDTNVDINDVSLSERNFGIIHDFFREFMYRDRLSEFGLSAANKLMFYGDTGCGKTYTGRAVCGLLNKECERTNIQRYHMLYASIADMMTGGNVARNLKLAFRVANSGNFVLFLDEIDSIAWNRNSVESADSADMRRALNTLFQNMDQLRQNSILICSSNLLHKLDVAFERRFNVKIHYEKPVKTDFIKHAKRFMKSRFVLNRDCEQDPTLESRMSLSFAEIENLVMRCEKEALLDYLQSGKDISKGVEISLKNLYKQATMYSDLNTVDYNDESRQKFV